MNPSLKLKMHLVPMKGIKESRDVHKIHELCLQLDPKTKRFVASPCKGYASWMCEAPLALKPVDVSYKWWMSTVLSGTITTIVLIVTVFLTYKIGHWIPEAADKSRRQSVTL